MNRVPGWADLRKQRIVHRMRQIVVAAFFLLLIIGADYYVQVTAQQRGKVEKPTLLDLVLFRRVVKNKNTGKQWVTLIGTYKYDDGQSRWR